MKIDQLVKINDCLLCVFHTESLGWQYSILFYDSSFYFPNESYQSADAAYRIGRAAIKTTLGY